MNKSIFPVNDIDRIIINYVNDFKLALLNKYYKNFIQSNIAYMQIKSILHISKCYIVSEDDKHKLKNIYHRLLILCEHGCFDGFEYMLSKFDNINNRIIVLSFISSCKSNNKKLILSLYEKTMRILNDKNYGNIITHADIYYNDMIAKHTKSYMFDIKKFNDTILNYKNLTIKSKPTQFMKNISRIIASDYDIGIVAECAYCLSIVFNNIDIANKFAVKEKFDQLIVWCCIVGNNKMVNLLLSTSKVVPKKLILLSLILKNFDIFYSLDGNIGWWIDNFSNFVLYTYADIDVIKYLYNKFENFRPIDNYNMLFMYLFDNKKLETIRWLEELNILVDPYYNNNLYFKIACKNNDWESIIWLYNKTVNNYKIYDDNLIKLGFVNLCSKNCTLENVILYYKYLLNTPYDYYIINAAFIEAVNNNKKDVAKYLYENNHIDIDFKYLFDNTIVCYLEIARYLHQTYLEKYINYNNRT